VDNKLPTVAEEKNKREKGTKKIPRPHHFRTSKGGKKRMDSSSTGAQYGWRIQVKENGREVDVQLSGSGTVSDVEVEQRAAKVRAILAFAIRGGPFRRTVCLTPL
jgi:hypothetical protein